VCTKIKKKECCHLPQVCTGELPHDPLCKALPSVKESVMPGQKPVRRARAGAMTAELGSACGRIHTLSPTSLLVSEMGITPTTEWAIYDYRSAVVPHLVAQWDAEC
jgi:hypothetical protein